MLTDMQDSMEKYSYVGFFRIPMEYRWYHVCYCGPGYVNWHAWGLVAHWHTDQQPEGMTMAKIQQLYLEAC